MQESCVKCLSLKIVANYLKDLPFFSANGFLLNRKKKNKPCLDRMEPGVGTVEELESTSKQGTVLASISSMGCCYMLTVAC